MQRALRGMAGEIVGFRRRLAKLHAALALPGDVSARLDWKKPYDLATELSSGIEEVRDGWLARAQETLESLCAATSRGLRAEHRRRTW